jgi:clathrin heavy chain
MSDDVASVQPKTTIINVFNEFLQDKKYSNAVKLACTDAETFRSKEVVESIKILFGPDEQNFAVEYFIQLSNETLLNDHESFEFCKVSILRQQLIENMINCKKLKITEKLADLLKSIDPRLAIEAYADLGLNNEVFNCLVMSESYDKIPLYMKNKKFTPDYIATFNTLLMYNKQRACEFAQIFLDENNEFKDYDKIIELYLKYDLVTECTSFLMELLKYNRKSESKLQTKLIEINLYKNPEIAVEILTNQMFDHFDRPYIASLCESLGFIKQALKLYTDFENIKRILLKPNVIDSKWLVNYFGLFRISDALDYLQAMLQTNKTQNLQICVEIAVHNRNKLGVKPIIQIFESSNSYEATFYFLNTFIDSIQSHEYVFKYLEAACKIAKIKEIERVCKENSYYEVEKVKNLLVEQNNSVFYDALVILYTRFNLVHDLILHFYRNDLIDSIDSFVSNSPKFMPEIIGALAFLNCSQVPIIRYLTSFTRKYSIEDVIREVGNHEKLIILKEYLEELVSKGSKNSFIHTALAKIYIQQKINAEVYLKENKYYISRVIGNFCEKTYPNLAFIAYSRSQVDDDIIRICYNNNMIKELVDYLIRRDKFNIWTDIFSKKNLHWRKILDFFVYHSVYGSYIKNELKTATKALLISDIKPEFIELLEHSIPKNSLLYEISKELIDLD